MSTSTDEQLIELVKTSPEKHTLLETELAWRLSAAKDRLAMLEAAKTTCPECAHTF